MTRDRALRRCAAALATALLALPHVPAHAQAAELAPADTAAVLAELRVENEGPPAAPVDAFGPWVDADGDGCDTFAEVLVAESVTTVTPGPPRCTVDLGHAGLWRSPWDDGTVGAGVLPVVEHAVPLGEAWRSGAHAWTFEDRSAFHNDLELEGALRAVTPMVSESRGDQDPAEWLPPVEAAWCDYVTDWIDMKWRWDLAVDPAERDVLAAVLDTCPPWPLFKTPFAATIYELVAHPDGSHTPVPISFQRWRDVYDFAPYEPTSTRIVRYPWSSTLYAVTLWPGVEDDGAIQRLTFAQWQYAGFPAPAATDWIPGSTLHRYATATQIFLTSPAGGVPHPLTYAEWEATGFEPFEQRGNEGFVKLSWDSGILHMTDLAASIGTKISFATWQQHGFPNPRVVDRLTGDRVYRHFGSRTIWYTGPTLSRSITFSEWQRMGFPAPEVRNIPSTADKDCQDYPDQAAAQRDLRLWVSEGFGDIFRLDEDRDGVACEGLR